MLRTISHLLIVNYTQFIIDRVNSLNNFSFQFFSPHHRYVDLFTLPTDHLTDEDGAFVTFHPSRLMGLFDMLNSDSMVDLISGLGVPKRKILMTMPANAYKFALKETTDNTPRSQTTERDPMPIDRKEVRHQVLYKYCA